MVSQSYLPTKPLQKIEHTPQTVLQGLLSLWHPAWLSGLLLPFMFVYYFLTSSFLAAVGFCVLFEWVFVRPSGPVAFLFRNSSKFRESLGKYAFLVQEDVSKLKSGNNTFELYGNTIARKNSSAGTKNKNNKKASSTTKSFACVTGCTSGIGLQFAKRLALDGFNLVLMGRNESRLEKADAEIRDFLKAQKSGAQLEKDLETVYLVTEACTADEKALKLPQHLKKIFNEKLLANNLVPDIAVFVNSAGVMDAGEFAETDYDKLTSLVDCNVQTTVCWTHLFLKYFRERNKKLNENSASQKRALLLNVASRAAYIHSPGACTYGGSKAFVQQFCESLAFEERMKKSNVDVMCLRPSLVSTPMTMDAELSLFCVSPEECVDGTLEKTVFFENDDFDGAALKGNTNQNKKSSGKNNGDYYFSKLSSFFNWSAPVCLTNGPWQHEFDGAYWALFQSFFPEAMKLKRYNGYMAWAEKEKALEAKKNNDTREKCNTSTSKKTTCAPTSSGKETCANEESHVVTTSEKNSTLDVNKEAFQPQASTGPHRTKSNRKRVCFQMKFATENLDEYLQDHKKVWPEMQQALVETGWHNYSLFYRKDGFAVGYYETDNDSHEESCTKMGATEINTTWQDAMSKYTAQNVRPDEAMQVLEQYFYLGNDRPDGDNGAECPSSTKSVNELKCTSTRTSVFFKPVKENATTIQEKTNEPVKREKCKLALVTDQSYKAKGRDYGSEDAFLKQLLELKGDFEVTLVQTKELEKEDFGNFNRTLHKSENPLYDTVLVRNTGPRDMHEKLFEKFVEEKNSVNFANDFSLKGDVQGKQHLLDLWDSETHKPKFEETLPGVMPTYLYKKNSKEPWKSGFFCGNSEIEKNSPLFQKENSLYEDSPYRKLMIKAMDSADSNGLLIFTPEADGKGKVSANFDHLLKDFPNGQEFIVQPLYDLEFEVSFFFVGNKFVYALSNKDASKEERWKLGLYDENSSENFEKEVEFGFHLMRWNNGFDKKEEDWRGIVRNKISNKSGLRINSYS